MSPRPRLHRRLFSRRGGAMLLRNTLASCTAFAFGLLLLWLFVDQWGINRVLAVALSLLCSSSLNYAVARDWVFHGSERAFASGYLFFIANAGIGIVATTALFALLTHLTAINYLVVRVLVSLVVGLGTFLLNATLNFRLL